MLLRPTTRRAWFIIVAGLAVAGTFCILGFTPAVNYEWGDAHFMAAGFAGLIVAGLGLALLHDARRRPASPV